MAAAAAMGTGVAGAATSIAEFAGAVASGVDGVAGADCESAADTLGLSGSSLLVVDAKGGASGSRLGGRFETRALTLGLGVSSKSVHMGGAGAARCETKAKT